VLLLILLAAALSGALAQNGGNVAALRQIIGGSAAGEKAPETANHYLAGLAAYSRGDFAAATEQLRAALPSHAAFARHWLALSLEQDGKPQEARSVLDVSNNAELSLYGDILLRDWEGAPAADRQDYLVRVQSRHPDWLLPFALGLLQEGHQEDAREWVQAIPQYTSSPDALVALGQVFLAQERTDEAIEQFERAYTLRPDALTGYWYGRWLAVGPEPQRGTAVLEQVIAAAGSDEPLLPWLLRDLGVGYARSGRCDEAQKILTRAAAVDPSTENQDRVATAVREYAAPCVSR
jgi:tetratricopeptide (TPR) repeat protein